MAEAMATIQVRKGEVVNLPSGQVIATGVSEDEYMENYASDFCEWVDGVVIKMMPVHERHDDLTQYFILLFRAYFAYRPVGKLRHAPFVQSLERKREPDLMIILESNPGTLTPTFMNGAADICIEVVSPDSVTRDYGEKFREYEKGGVREYWIFDPLRNESRFYRLDEKGIYRTQKLDKDGNYQTPLLPGLLIHEADVWRSPLPDFLAIGEAVKKMLAQ